MTSSPWVSQALSAALGLCALFRRFSEVLTPPSMVLSGWRFTAEVFGIPRMLLQRSPPVLEGRQRLGRLGSRVSCRVPAASADSTVEGALRRQAELLHWGHPEGEGVSVEALV